MLNDAKGFRRIIIACGKTDLRRGMFSSSYAAIAHSKRKSTKRSATLGICTLCLNSAKFVYLDSRWSHLDCRGG